MSQPFVRELYISMQSICKHISFLDPTNTEEVQSYIKTIKNDKSTSPSSITKKLFKQFKEPLSEPLTLLINPYFPKANSHQFLKWVKSFLYTKKVAKLK